jgi:hypothetical protein
MMAGAAVGHADHLDDVALPAIKRRQAAGGKIGIVRMGAEDQDA